MSELRRIDGMTLLEVMITLGIASIMMIGILQIVNLSQRSTRNVTINADWNNFVSNVKLSLSLDDSCKKYLGGNHNYKWIPAGGIDQNDGSPVGTMSQIDRPAPAAMVLAKVGTNYKSFTLSGISLTPQSPAFSSVTGTYHGTSYSFNVYQGSLSMTATKNTMEPTPLGGKNLSMSIPIPLTIVTGPETNLDGTPTGLAQEGIIYSCHSDSTDPQAICEAMGGQYLTVAPAHCYFPYFSNFAGAPSTYGAVGETYGAGNYPGARLQLYSKNGGYKNPQASDYMIGYSDQQMWFNIGGSAGAGTIQSPNLGLPINSFVWTQVAEAGSGNTTHLMALDKSGVLVLNPRLEADNSMLAFGGGVDAGGNLVAPTEKIESHPSFDDLTFSTGGQSRMVIRNDGTVVVGPTGITGTSNGVIAFAKYTPGSGPEFDSSKAASIQSDTTKGDLTLRAMSPNVPPALTDAVQDRLVLGKDGTNNIFGALIVKKLADPQQYAVLDGSTSSIYGSLTLGQPGATGTVPYGCHRQDMDVGPMPSGHAKVTATCPAGEILLGGGGNCNIAGGIDYYMSINGPAFVSQQWWVKCESVDPAKAASLQSYVYAFCCKH
ncbi:prepilin-type N-terminal cleavage/methylation domain-containing protein [Bdellovibrionota bacterium FG-1]